MKISIYMKGSAEIVLHDAPYAKEFLESLTNSLVSSRFIWFDTGNGGMMYINTDQISHIVASR